MKIRIINESSESELRQQMSKFFYDVLGISGRPEYYSKNGILKGTYSFFSEDGVAELRRRLEIDDDFVDIADSTNITDEGWVVTYEYEKSPYFSVLLISNFGKGDNSVQVTARYDK